MEKTSRLATPAKSKIAQGQKKVPLHKSKGDVNISHKGNTIGDITGKKKVKPIVGHEKSVPVHKSKGDINVKKEGNSLKSPKSKSKGETLQRYPRVASIKTRQKMINEQGLSPIKHGKY